MARSLEVCVVAPSAPGLGGAEVLDGVPVVRFRYAPRRWETLAYTGSMAEDVRRSSRAKLAMAGLMVATRATLRRVVREFRPAVVHAHWWFPSGLAAAAGGVASIPLITTLHGTDVRLARELRAAVPFLRHVMSRSSEVTAVSRFVADEARRLVPGASPAIAPMPAATELFRPPGESDRRGLLFVGRLNAQKGVAALLRALSVLDPSVTLDIVGHGSDRDALVETARRLGVDERVRWHGALPQQRLAALFGAAALVVVPSVEEGLGLVAVEALLCETPVVAYRSGGLVDVVDDGVTGMLVDPGTSDALAATVRRLLGDPARAAAMGRAGRARMLERFSPESVTERYLEIYGRAMAPAASRGRGA